MAELDHDPTAAACQSLLDDIEQEEEASTFG